jgi:hypothetical protein
MRPYSITYIQTELEHSMSPSNCDEISDSQLLDFVQQIEIPPHVEKELEHSMDLSNYDMMKLAIHNSSISHNNSNFQRIQRVQSTLVQRSRMSEEVSYLINDDIMLFQNSLPGSVSAEVFL